MCEANTATAGGITASPTLRLPPPRYIEIFKSSRNEIRAYYELPRRPMGQQRPGPYDRPMMGGPRGVFFAPGPGRGGPLMEPMRSGGGYGGGESSRGSGSFAMLRLGRTRLVDAVRVLRTRKQ